MRLNNPANTLRCSRDLCCFFVCPRFVLDFLSMTVAIVTGGETGEREVSLASAKHLVSLLTFVECKTFVFPEERENFLERAAEIDVVIPMIHGKGGEDGGVQQLCETLGIPFVFSPIDAHRIGIDKVLAKEFATRANLKTPKRFSKSNAAFPVFVKPRFGGSSVHTARIENQNELDAMLANAQDDMMIEEAITGREFTVGVIEQNPGDPEALPVVEIVSNGTFFDYTNKYDADHLAREICPAQIDSSLAKQLQDAAVAMHALIGASHVSRTDFLVTDTGEIVFLEINTIPGFTETSLLPKMLRVAKIDIAHLFERWMSGVSYKEKTVLVNQKG